MSEPPRPPGDDNAGTPSDPTRPFSQGDDPSQGQPPPPPPYSPPPTSGAGYPPPTSGGGYVPPPADGGFPQPPTSGAGGYPPGGGTPPPYGDPAQGYGAPGPGAPGYGAPGYGAPGYGDPGYGTPGYGTPGYGAKGYGAPGYATSDDRTWSLLAHFGGAVGAFVSGGPLAWVGPLIAYLAKGEQSPTIRAHALAALNFQLLWSIIAFVTWFVSWCLFFIPSLIIFGIQIAFGVIAGIKAANGEPYKYPMTVNFIK
jgi:uncharacterized Tic20 family protein